MAQNWNAKLQFPTDSNYVNRICAGQFKQSSAGNPMVVLTFEVLAPQEVEIAGEATNIAGVKCDSWYVTTVFDGDQIDQEATKKARDKFKQLCGWLDVDVESINWENIDTKPFIGKTILSMMEGRADIQRKTPTMEQIAAAKKLGKKPEGDILKNPVTKEPLVQYWPRIVEVFGAAPEGAGSNQPY